MTWVGPDDALLVYDRDGDRLISHRDEFAFADYLANAKSGHSRPRFREGDD